VTKAENVSKQVLRHNFLMCIIFIIGHLTQFGLSSKEVLTILEGINFTKP